MRRIVLMVAVLFVGWTAAAVDDKQQANSYDDAWQEHWVEHCRKVYRVIGKTRGFTLHIGDSNTRSHPYIHWPRSGAGKTSEDVEICTWAWASTWVEGKKPNPDCKNGWYLAYAEVSRRRGFTTVGSMRTNDFLSGKNGNEAMPRVLFQPLALSIVADGAAYPDALQAETMASAFQDAQFAVLMAGSPDAQRLRAASEFVADLEKMVRILEDRNVVVILSTLPPDFDDGKHQAARQFNDAIRKLAQEHGLPLIDFYREIASRRPGDTWKGTLVKQSIYLTAKAEGLNAGSDPYADGGDRATHATGNACTQIGFLLKSWLTVQKLKEVKARLVDLEPQALEAEIEASRAELARAETDAGRVAGIEGLSDLLVQANRTNQALELCEAKAGEIRDEPAKAKVLGLKARILAFNMKADAEAIPVYERIVKECPSATQAALEARIQLAEIANRRQQPAEAVKVLREILKDADAAAFPEHVTWLKSHLSGLLEASGRLEEAAAMHKELAEKSLSPDARRKSLLDMAGVQVAEKKFDEAVDTYRKVIAENIADLPACLDAQKAIVQARLDGGEPGKAVAEALRFYAAAHTPAALEEACKSVAQALRAADEDNERAIEFLKFQKFGPPARGEGQASMYETLLEEFPVAPNPKEGEALAQALAKLPGDAAGRRKRAYLNLFFGQPAASMAEFKKLYWTAPIDPRALQAAADDVTVGLKAIQGHVHGAEQFFEYQTYGPKGKDGQSNLEDPLGE